MKFLVTITSLLYLIFFSTTSYGHLYCSDATASEVVVHWHKLCAANAKDLAVYMPHKTKRLINNGKISLFITPPVQPTGMVAHHSDFIRAISNNASIRIELKQVANSKFPQNVEYPEINSPASAFLLTDVQKLKLMALKTNFDSMNLIVVNEGSLLMNSKILGSSSYLPSELFYEQRRVEDIQSDIINSSTALTDTGSAIHFRVNIGFLAKTFQDTDSLTDTLFCQCDTTMTPLALIFGSEKASDLKDGILPMTRTNFDLLQKGSSSYKWPVSNEQNKLAWIAYDRNNDGKVNDGTELFGPGQVAGNGFSVISELDINKDRVLKGKEISQLKLWFDKNADGKTDPKELIQLTDRVSEISLDVIVGRIWSNGKSHIPLHSTAKLTNGKKSIVADFYLEKL